MAEQRDVYPYEPAKGGPAGARLELTLDVTDAELVEDLTRLAPGGPREEFALTALRIGALTLKRAQGQLDAELLKREADRVLDNMTATLKQFFDPNDGRFTERVDNLVKKDGEIEELMKSQIGQDNSVLARTLAAHFGEQSPIMQFLSADETKGFLKALSGNIKGQLDAQRQVILKQFSLDEEGSAIRRLIDNVTASHKTITKEFTLDDEKSALSRMQVAIINELGKHEKANSDFHLSVSTAIATLKATRAEANRSTRHGTMFEELAISHLHGLASALGDAASSTGNTTGLIKNCKVGDAVIELFGDANAAWARIAVEVKDKKGYSLADALEEIETAKKNRNAEICLFIFSKNSAPPGQRPMSRIGHSVIVSWDAEDPSTDIYFEAGYSLARALCAQAVADSNTVNLDVASIKSAVVNIENQTAQLDEVTTWTTTIQTNAGKILKSIIDIKAEIQVNVGALNGQVGAMQPLAGAPKEVDS